MSNRVAHPSEYAEKVMQMVMDYLYDNKIAHDSGDNTIYFNDTKTKKTYMICMEECPCYEGE